MVMVSLTAVAAFAAPSTNLDSYVLFATGAGLSDSTAPLSFKGGNTEGTGLVSGGNVGVNRADGNFGNSTAMINVGENGRFIMSPGTQLVGDSIRLGIEAVVYDVYFDGRDAAKMGNGWAQPGVINGTVAAFDAPIFDPFPQLFDPSFVAGTSDITVSSGTTYNGGLALAPGAYRDLQVQDGATIYLAAGTYTFRRFNTGQNFRVYTVPGTVIQVTGDTDPNSQDLSFNGNSSFVGSADPNVESVALFRFLGTDVSFSDNSTFYGVILAPNADIGLGRAMTHYGRFISKQIHSDYNDNIFYRQFTPVPEPSAFVALLGGISALATFGRLRRAGR